MIVFTIHCWKRYYETHYISVFSDVYMNFAIYLIGLFHYYGSIIAIVGESQNIANGISNVHATKSVYCYMFINFIN